MLFCSVSEDPRGAKTEENMSKIQPVGAVEEQQVCFRRFGMSTSKLKVLNVTEMEVVDGTLGSC